MALRKIPSKKLIVAIKKFNNMYLSSEGLKGI